jgi:RNA polymerase sigma-70 factor (ECF subfamily)
MEDLVRQARRGDVAAFEALYRSHVGRVHALCRRLGDPGRAEEMTQEVFVKAWRNLGSCPVDRPFPGWLCRVAIHLILTDNRSTRRRSRWEVSGGDSVSQARGASPAPTGLALDLERAIEQLPPGARQVFVLHDVEGYGHEEIARLLGVSAGTSKAQLHRARRLLREALGS